MSEPLFVLSRDDWSLHRKGELDQERHKRKVKEAIRQNLADLVSEESIILPQGDKVLKVPVRSMSEPKFRFNYDNQPHVGQGGGGTEVGDVIGRAPGQGQQAGPGKGKQAGDQAGEDCYEAEITVDELAELVFEDLQLPRLKPKNAPDMTSDDIRFNDVRRQGMMGNIDKKRTLIEAMKRQALSGGAGGGQAAAAAFAHAAAMEAAGPVGPIRNEDLRFKTWEDIRKPVTSAVVLAMMDTSGSMGTFEKYIARSFYFWMVRFLRTKYDHVGIRFLAHHTEAKEVNEEQFFSRGESGGTKCSSVYELALQLVEQEYPASQYNIYAFHFSDGDNYESDNARTVQLAQQLLGGINLLGYGEIRQYSHSGGRLWDAMEAIRHPGFVSSVLKEKTDVYRTLKLFFGDAMPEAG